MESEIINVTTIKSIFTPGDVAGIFDVRWVILINFVFYVSNYKNIHSSDVKSTSSTRTEMTTATVTGARKRTERR